MLAPSGWPTIFAPMLTRPKATPTQQAALALGVVLAAGLGAGAGVGLVFAMALADRGGGAFPFPLAGLLVGTSSGCRVRRRWRGGGKMRACTAGVRCWAACSGWRWPRC
jgi:hypothetical protein